MYPMIGAVNALGKSRATVPANFALLGESAVDYSRRGDFTLHLLRDIAPHCHGTRTQTRTLRARK